MKTIASFILCAFVLFAASCKKGDSTEETATASGSWKLGSTSYSIKFSYKSTTSGGETLFNFYDAMPVGGNFSTLNSVSASFRNAPTASGSYQLVGIGTTTTGNQFQISAGGPAGAYAYIGSPVTVDVTVSGGKVKFTIPEISMKSTGSNPNVNLSGSVSEL